MQPSSNALWSGRLFLGLVALSCCGACVTQPKEEPPPPLTVSFDSFSGSVLTGPVTDEPSLGRPPWSVALRVARIERLPEDTGEPLTGRVRHVFVKRSGEPLKTRAELASGVRIAGGAEPLAEPVWEERHLEALWPGTTVRWSTAHNAALVDPAQTRWDAFGLRVSRPVDEPELPERFELVLSFEGWVTPAVEDDVEPAQPVYQAEHLVLETAALSTEGVLRLLLPAPREGLPLSAEVLEVELTTAPDLDRPELRAAVERGRASIAKALELARVDAQVPAEESELRFELARALEALRDDAPNRPALLFVAEETGAEPTSELALLADDESLAAFLTELREPLADPDLAIDDPNSFGWFLERATYRWLAELATDPERTLPPELASLLMRQAGELGRYPDLVLETVDASSDQADARRRFLAENRIFLEDSHPAARVRAFDWLRSQRAEPAGYDPLGSLAERREALARLEEDEE